MKKILSYILLLAMALSLFAGCAPTEQGPDLTGLDKAKTYLFNLYKDSPVVTTSSYDVVGVVVIQGYGTYNVTWSSDCSDITFTTNGKMVTVGIPGSPADEITYKLIGTLDDGNGNTAKVEFEHKIPAGGNLADGTYVILAGNLTMSSLAQDKGYGYPTANEVTVEGGKVSNHFKADVLTITRVGDSYTIQDAYGRYFYLKGSYNSFNVSAEIPADGGHLFTIGKEGDGYTIVNDLMSKTLAYDTGYTSWGCYPEIGDSHNAILTIIPATAPSSDPVTPEDPTDPTEPSNPSNPSTPSSGLITSPATGVPYKMSLYQGNKKQTLYFMGVISADNTPWYMKSSTNEADAIDVYLEAATGGYRLYFNINGTKTYLVMYKDGTHYSLKLTTEPSTVYTWNTQYNTLVAMNEDKECFIGTSSTYVTFSCNKMENIGSSFIAQFYGEGGSSTPSTPSEPSTPSTPSNPSGGNTGSTDVKLTNGMKVVIYNPANGKALSSQPSSSGSYYQLGVDVTLSGSTLTGYSDTEIWTVVANSDGTFSFEQGGQKIALGTQYSSMKLGEVNDKWEVISLGNGLFNIKNAARGNIIEWYASKNNWSTYTSDSAATDPLFQMSFYVVG